MVKRYERQPSGLYLTDDSIAVPRAGSSIPRPWWSSQYMPISARANQIKFVGDPPQILFNNGQIVFNPDCCCDEQETVTCSNHCVDSKAPKYFTASFSGYSFSEPCEETGESCCPADIVLEWDATSHLYGLDCEWCHEDLDTIWCDEEAPPASCTQGTHEYCCVGIDRGTNVPDSGTSFSFTEQNYLVLFYANLASGSHQGLHAWIKYYGDNDIDCLNLSIGTGDWDDHEYISYGSGIGNGCVGGQPDLEAELFAM